MDRPTYDEDKLRFELIRDEGKRLTPYKDTEGNWTVGIGHLMEDQKGPKAPITERQCLDLFHADIRSAEYKLNRMLPAWRRFSDVRQRALLNLAFNMGYRLAKFVRFLDAMLWEDYATAGEHLKDSKWAQQVKLRAPRIIHMIQTDSEWEGD